MSLIERMNLQIAGATEQTAQSSAELARLGGELQQRIGRFRS